MDTFTTAASGAQLGVTLRAAWILAALACFPSHPQDFHKYSENMDTSPVRIAFFSQDAEVQRRVLGMRFDEAVARLGALSLRAESDFVFSRGGSSYAQRDRYQATQDQDGSIAVALITPHAEVAFYIKDNTAYVRQDKGKLRRRAAQDVNPSVWTETAWSTLRQTLGLFGDRLVFAAPRAERVGQREANRYDITLRPADVPAMPNTAAPIVAAGDPLPVAPLPRWRALAVPLDVSGVLWLDAATGVPLRTTLDGRLEIPDRPIRPTQLTLHYVAEVSTVGDMPPIAIPKSVPEPERRQRETYPFLRQFQPQEEPVSATATEEDAPDAENERESGQEDER